MEEPTFQIRSYPFNQNAIGNLAANNHAEEKNWPVVYQIYNDDKIYIGETTNLKSRMSQHLTDGQKVSLRGGCVKVVFDDTFNKSAELDLESYLIQYFSADGRYKVLNRNDGMCDRNYYDKPNYRATFEKIWDKLRELGIASRTISALNNSELFRFSPYKNLNFEQLEVVMEIVQNIDEAFVNGRKSLSVIDGDAGTGKTIVITYLTKLLADLQNFDGNNDDIDDESNFNTFFTVNNINQHFKHKKIVLVVPQSSLCERIRKIFDKVDLGDADVGIMSPMQFGNCDENFDITLVDEAHLLKIGKASVRNDIIADINMKLFGDDKIHSELDWIMAKSQNVVLVFSEQQRIRQINIDHTDIAKYAYEFNQRNYYLRTQMRSCGGKAYIDYIHDIFSNNSRPDDKEVFDNFEAKLFNNIEDFVSAIKTRERECGLSRMVAGFAWEWKSKKSGQEDDIIIGNTALRWNSTQKNWIGSKNAPNEAGSIYTVQGDDLNYVGVIIGKDLIYRNGKLIFNRSACADSAAIKRNQRQVANNEQLDEDDLLEQVLRTYRILMNRAVKGVYIYACDSELKAYLAQYFDRV